MNRAEKLEMARRLRAEAEGIRRHGLTNFFEHTYACVRYGQASKEREEDRCVLCPLRPYVPEDYQEEAFPCQHINEPGWERAGEEERLAEKIADSLLNSATQVEAEAA
jgi:hypothetical protein